jgi:hypothetical protein
MNILKPIDKISDREDSIFEKERKSVYTEQDNID